MRVVIEAEFIGQVVGPGVVRAVATLRARVPMGQDRAALKRVRPPRPDKLAPNFFLKLAVDFDSPLRSEIAEDKGRVNVCRVYRSRTRTHRLLLGAKLQLPLGSYERRFVVPTTTVSAAMRALETKALPRIGAKLVQNAPRRQRKLLTA